MLIFFSHLRLGLTSFLFPTIFSLKLCVQTLSHGCHMTYQFHSLDLITRITFEEEHKFWISRYVISPSSLQYICCSSSIEYTGLFEMIVGVLTTCHTQCTWDRSWCLYNHKGCTYRPSIRYVTKAWSVVLLNKKNTYTPISSALCMTSC